MPTPEWADGLEEVDRLYCDDPDDLNEKLTGFARRKGLVQPFEKEAEAEGDGERRSAP